VKIVVASTYVPFREGRRVTIVDDLQRELTARGFTTDAVRIPFDPSWLNFTEQALALRLLDLTEASGEPIDRLITVHTPAYALRHPNKVAWLHRCRRDAYDLWGTPWGDIPEDETGRRYRDMMRHSDAVYLRECKKIFTISQTAADRLKRFSGLDGDGVLYPPPQDAVCPGGDFGDYFLLHSRLQPVERPSLVIEAMKHTRPEVRVVLSAVADADSCADAMREQVRESGLESRVAFEGWTSEERKAELLAGCCGVLFPAHQEDDASATLEALQAGKPVVALTDSGATLEFIEDGVNGLVAEPQPQALAAAMDRLWMDRAEGRRLGEAGRETRRRQRIDWDHVIENLTA
jgi:glycosyltransferase involved in cell wall biosynthesis